jgi:hypothetical protein
MRLIHLTLLLVIFSCAPTIKNFDDYQKQFLSKTAFMPTKENLEGKPVKIVVFALDENNNEIAMQSGLGESIAGSIENILSKNRLCEIVDRKAAVKLQKEIALSEMNKTGSYKGPLVADYAISGTISNAGFTSKYSAGFFYPNPKTGEIITVPPKYTYSTDVSGNLKVYELPSLSVVESIEFSEKERRSENVKQDGGLSLGALQIGGKKVDGASQDNNMLRKTGAEAIEDIEVNIKNFFAKKGYILEKRVYENKTIFKISLGSLDGVNQGDKFEITGQYESQNSITEEVEIEKRIIADGIVTDKIDPKTSWVILKDSKKVNSVRLGDAVKMKYKKNGFAKIGKITESLLEQ